MNQVARSRLFRTARFAWLLGLYVMAFSALAWLGIESASRLSDTSTFRYVGF